MSFGSIAIGIGLVAGAGAAIYGANKQGQVASTQLGLEQQTQSEQMQMFAQLQQLINDPNSFFSSPVYQAAFGQGTQAIARAGAAGGLNNTSTNVPQGQEATELQAYGQSFGQQQLLAQEQLLLSGAGVTSASSPAQAGAAASGAYSAQTGNLGSLAGLLTFLGGSGTLGGSGSPYTYGPGGLNPGSAPNNYWPGGANLNSGGGFTDSWTP